MMLNTVRPGEDYPTIPGGVSDISRDLIPNNNKFADGLQLTNFMRGNRTSACDDRLDSLAWAELDSRGRRNTPLRNTKWELKHKARERRYSRYRIDPCA
jgi:hypothetical protein